MRHLKNNLVPAFTLTEVLVTMALSSILVVLTYAVYSMLGIYFGRVTASNDLHAERLAFRTVFNRDLDTADSLRLQNNQLELFRGDNTVQWKLDGENMEKEGQVFKAGPYALRVRPLEGTIGQLCFIWPKAGEDSSSFCFFKHYPLSFSINR